MTELKTLKDIEKDYGHSGVHFYGYAKEDMRHEAIKEINELRNGNADKISTGIIDVISVILYIKWKNNITDEDLK